MAGSARIGPARAAYRVLFTRTTSSRRRSEAQTDPRRAGRVVLSHAGDAYHLAHGEPRKAAVRVGRNTLRVLREPILR
jgi:hypothetical protein